MCLVLYILRAGKGAARFVKSLPWPAGDFRRREHLGNLLSSLLFSASLPARMFSRASCTGRPGFPMAMTRFPGP